MQGDILDDSAAIESASTCLWFISNGHGEYEADPKITLAGAAVPRPRIDHRAIRGCLRASPCAQ